MDSSQCEKKLQLSINCRRHVCMSSLHSAVALFEFRLSWQIHNLNLVSFSLATQLKCKFSDLGNDIIFRLNLIEMNSLSQR